MGQRQHNEEPPQTLGDVLYANQTATVVVEQDWEALVHRIAEGDQAALHALYGDQRVLVFVAPSKRSNGERAVADLVAAGFVARLVITLGETAWFLGQNVECAAIAVGDAVPDREALLAFLRDAYPHARTCALTDLHSAKLAIVGAEDAQSLVDERYRVG